MGRRAAPTAQGPAVPDRWNPVPPCGRLASTLVRRCPGTDRGVGLCGARGNRWGGRRYSGMLGIGLDLGLARAWNGCRPLCTRLLRACAARRGWLCSHGLSLPGAKRRCGRPHAGLDLGSRSSRRLATPGTKSRPCASSRGSAPGTKRCAPGSNTRWRCPPCRRLCGSRTGRRASRLVTRDATSPVRLAHSGEPLAALPRARCTCPSGPCVRTVVGPRNEQDLCSLGLGPKRAGEGSGHSISVARRCCSTRGQRSPAPRPRASTLARRDRCARPRDSRPLHAHRHTTPLGDQWTARRDRRLVVALATRPRTCWRGIPLGAPLQRSFWTCVDSFAIRHSTWRALATGAGTRGVCRPRRSRPPGLARLSRCGPWFGGPGNRRPWEASGRLEPLGGRVGP